MMLLFARFPLQFVDGTTIGPKPKHVLQVYSDDLIYACILFEDKAAQIVTMQNLIWFGKTPSLIQHHIIKNVFLSHEALHFYYSISEITIMASSTSTTPTDLSQQIALHDLLNTISPTIWYIWYRLHVLLFDLQNFNRGQDSRERLDAVIDPSYIGAPYFTIEEATRIKQMAITENTTFEQTISEKLDERLGRRMQTAETG